MGREGGEEGQGQRVQSRGEGPKGGHLRRGQHARVVDCSAVGGGELVRQGEGAALQSLGQGHGVGIGVGVGVG